MIAGVLGILFYRLYQCLLLPVETGDIARNILYGAMVDQHGLIAASLPLSHFSDAWNEISWARFPFSYPPVTLAFFALVAAVSPTIAAAKICLTAIEAVNAYLIGRLTNSSRLALLYWASPLSIWWVSREGQFEPLQAMFSLLAILLLTGSPMWAGVAIALAINVKVTAGALLPYMAWRMWKLGNRHIVAGVIGLLLGFVPALLAEIAYGGASNVLKYGSLLIYNPYYWNPAANMFSWNSGIQVLADQIVTWAFVLVLVWFFIKDRLHPGYIAAIAFLLFCKFHTNVQFWYMLLVPSFLVTVPRDRLRFALISLCPLLDIRGALEAFCGPFEQKTFHGLPSVFSRYG